MFRGPRDRQLRRMFRLAKTAEKLYDKRRQRVSERSGHPAERETEVGQVIAAAGAERPRVRKVRASQGRMPDNVRWR